MQPATDLHSKLRWEIAPVSHLHRLQAGWQQLHASAWPTPVLAFDFLAALVHGFARGDECVVAGYLDARPVAMGVFQREASGRWLTFQPSQAPMGVWLHDPALDLEQILRSMLRALPGMVLIVGLTQQDPLRCARPRDGACLATLDYVSTGSVLINRSFEVYWAERDKELRRKLKRRLARLGEQGLVPRLETIRDAARVPELITAFGEMESAGWKAGLGTAVHASNAQGAFYRDLMTRFCRLGRGRIYRYVAESRVLAMTLCIEHEGTLASLKTTYDESLRACAPGVLMKWEMFRELFADAGIQRVEFYGSIKEWQLKWIDATRTLYHVNAYRFTLLRSAHVIAARLRRARMRAPTPEKAAPSDAAEA